MLTANAATQTDALTTLTANAASQAIDLNTLTANAASQAIDLNTLTANAASQAIDLNTLTANAATQADSLTNLIANAATQTDALTTLTANAASQAIALNTLDANVGAITLDLGSITSGANANTAAYLLTYAGNIGSGNIAVTTQITTANLTITGNVTQQSAYYEAYANVANTGGNLTCNFVNGGIFYATLTANVTVNFTNVVATAGRVTGATLIVDQGATPYGVANIQINSGDVQTVKYAGGTPNKGTASNTDIMSFSLISLDGTNWRVLGQISNYA